MIHLSSHFHHLGGWGSLARGFGQALDRMETVTAHSWDVQNPRTRVEEDSIGIGLGPWQNMPYTLGGRRIAAICGETTRVPASLLQNTGHAEQIWVPTAWGRDNLVRSGVSAGRIRVVPYGVDTQLYRPAHRQPRERFRFLSVGKWEKRKGSEELVRSFCRAFAPISKVELYLHCHNPYLPDLDLPETVARIQQEEGGGPPIHLGAPLAEAELIALYQSADAFVLPSRGEGWGLPILEAMSCGLPVLVTDHGGHRVFAHPGHAHLIPVARHCQVEDPLFFDPSLDWGDWAEPDWQALVEMLRRVAASPRQCRTRGELAREEALRWTWDNAAEVAHREIVALRRQISNLKSEENAAWIPALPAPRATC